MKDTTDMARELTHRKDFTDADWKERVRYVGLLRNFMGMSVAVEKAINVIKSKKLYRPHPSLKEFCIRECGWSQRRAQQIIAGAKVVASLPPKSEPLVRTERAARELVNVPEDKRAEVLDDALRFHSNDGKITAGAIREAASYHVEEERVDDNGKPIPSSARTIWDRRGEAEEVLAKMRSVKRVVNALEDTDLMWCEVSLQGVLADLSSAISRFASAVPAYVCPYCKGIKVEGCRACKGRGCMSKFMYTHAVPEEMKR